MFFGCIIIGEKLTGSVMEIVPKSRRMQPELDMEI